MRVSLTSGDLALALGINLTEAMDLCDRLRASGQEVAYGHSLYVTTSTQEPYVDCYKLVAGRRLPAPNKPY